jgi:integrase
MQLYKRKGIYQVSFQLGGRQVRRSLKTSSKTIATQRAAKLELELHETQLFGKEPERSFKELMITYLEAKQRTRGYSRLQSGARHLLAFFGNSKLSEISPSSVERYVTLRSERVKDGTIKREAGILSAAFNHVIQKHGWKVTNPCIAADLPSDPKGRVRFLTRPEAARLVQAARKPVTQSGKPLCDFHKSPVLADFIELALNTGCRKQELLGLKWSDVDLSTRLLRLSTTKAGEWQTVPINEEARQVILRRQKRRDEVCPDSPYVFFHEVKRGDVEVGGRVQDLKNSFKTACKQAGIEDFRIHDLRHTFASWLVMDGVPLFDVSRLLRHSNIRMTEKYAHLAPDHLHQAVAGRGFSAHFQHTENSLKAVA